MSKKKKTSSKDLNITVEMGLTDMDYKPQKSSFDFMGSSAEASPEPVGKESDKCIKDVNKCAESAHAQGHRSLHSVLLFSHLAIVQ